MHLYEFLIHLKKEVKRNVYITIQLVYQSRLKVSCDNYVYFIVNQVSFIFDFFFRILKITMYSLICHIKWGLHRIITWLFLIVMIANQKQLLKPQRCGYVP